MKPQPPPNASPDPMEAWLDAKRALRPTANLASSVMAVINDQPVQASPAQPGPVFPLAWWREALGLSWAQAAVLVLAAAAGLGRVLLVWMWLFWT